MTRRSKIWLVVAALFTVVNAVSAVPAFLAGELFHTGVHVVLALVGAYYVQRIWRREISGIPALAGEVGGEFSNRLTNLEQSVDAVAIEVERIGEGQRFITNFFTEKGVPRAPADGAAEPIEVKDATRRTR